MSRRPSATERDFLIQTLEDFEDGLSEARKLMSDPKISPADREELDAYMESCRTLGLRAERFNQRCRRSGLVEIRNCFPGVSAGARTPNRHQESRRKPAKPEFIAMLKRRMKEVINH